MGRRVQGTPPEAAPGPQTAMSEAPRRSGGGTKGRAGSRVLLACLSAAVALSCAPATRAHPRHARRESDHGAAGRKAALLQTSAAPEEVGRLPGIFVDGFRSPDEPRAPGAAAPPGRGRLARAGVNVGDLPFGRNHVQVGQRGPEGGIPGVFFPPFSKKDAPLSQTKSDSPMGKERTVEEQAVYNAAYKAERAARRAEQQSKQLRQNMQHKVDVLQRQIAEMKSRIAKGDVPFEPAAPATTITVSPLAPRRARASARFSSPAGATLSAPPGHAALAGAKKRLKIKRALSRVVKAASTRAPDEDAAGIVLPPGMRAAAAPAGARNGALAQLRKYPVLSVSEDGQEVIVSVANGVFGVGPDRLALVHADGGEQVLPYGAATVTEDGIRFRAPPGITFGADAAYARPAGGLRFLVARVEAHEMLVDAANDGVFAPGPALMRVVLASGAEQVVQYASMEVVLADRPAAGWGAKAGAPGAALLGDLLASPRPLLKMKPADDCVFPADAAYAAPLDGAVWATNWHQGATAVGSGWRRMFAAPRLPVLRVASGGREVVLGADAGDDFAPGPSHVDVELGTCAVVGAPYARMRVAEGGDVVLSGAEGGTFAASAVAVLPVAGAQPLYSVYWRAADGGSMRIQAPADWRGEEGEARGAIRVVVALADGSQRVYALATAEPVAHDAAGPAGVLLTAAAGSSFPESVASAGPAGPAAEEETGLALSFLDSVGAKPYAARAALGAGERLYVDREYVYTGVPAVLRGAAFVATAQGDARSRLAAHFMTFWVNEPADVYVLYDAGASEVPEWLRSGFLPAGLRVETTRGPLMAWRSKGSAEGAVYLGGNAAAPAAGGDSMFTVVVAAARAHHAPPPAGVVASCASASAQYPVSDVTPDGKCATVQARTTASLPPATPARPAQAEVERADGALVAVEYVAARAVQDGARGTAVELCAAEGGAFPADAVGASAAPTARVADVAPSGARMTVEAPNDGCLAPGPATVKVRVAGGAQADFPYESSRAVPGGIELEAPRGMAFPADAVQAGPGADPVACMVTYVSPQRDTLRCSGGSAAGFPPGPAEVRLVNNHGVIVSVPYDKVAHVASDVNGPAGMQFTAGKALDEEGQPLAEAALFPHNAATAEPLAFPVLSVAPGGRQAVVGVPGSGAFPPGGGVAKLTTADGDSKEVPYLSASLLPTASNGAVRLLLTAQDAGAFPHVPAFVAPASAPPLYRDFPARPVLMEVLAVVPPAIPGITAGALRVAAPPAGTFPPKGGFATVLTSDGGEREVPYTSAALTADDEGVLELALAPGAEVPGDAVLVAPRASAVMYRSEDGAMLQVAAPNDGAFRPGPGELLATLAGGEEKTLKYDTVSKLADGVPAGGLLLTAPPGEKFPEGITAVTPAPQETAPALPPSKTLSVSKDGGELTLAPASDWPSAGVAVVTRADGSDAKVQYGGLSHSAGQFVVTLGDGASVTVPEANVKKVPAREEFATPDGKQHSLPPSALEPKSTDPSRTTVTVTLPNGVTAQVKQSDLSAAPAEASPDMRLSTVELPSGERVEIPGKDLVPLAEVASVALADGSVKDVPATALQPFQSGEAPGTVRVQLPDGNLVTVPRDDVRISKLPEPGSLVQVRLPDGLYAVVGKDEVRAAAPPFKVELPSGMVATVPRRNVEFPPAMLVATLDDGSRVEVKAEDVHSVAAHLRVTLPDGEVLRLPPSSVARAGAEEGSAAVEPNVVLRAAPGQAFPQDAMYVAPGGRPAMAVEAVSGDGYRMTVACAPGDFPEGPGKVLVKEMSGRTVTVPYQRAEPTLQSRTPAGPPSAVQAVAEDGKWVQVAAPAALAAAPGAVIATDGNGVKTVVPYKAVQPQGAGLVVTAAAGAAFPAGTTQVAPAGKQEVVLSTQYRGEFPPDAAEVSPLDAPQASFDVVDVAPEGRTLRADVPDDGTFPPGPALVRLLLDDGAKQLAPYDAVTAVLPDGAGAAGLLFTAPPDVPFPANVRRVLPTAGFWPGGSAVGPADARPPVTAAQSSQALGPPAPVRAVASDGRSAVVGPYALFPAEGGAALVLTRAGDERTVPLAGAEKQLSDDGRVVEHVLRAAPGGAAFPRDAITVQPVMAKALQVGAAVPGAALYSDDAAHTLVAVPPELEGLPMVMTDNGDKGSARAEALTFDVAGWAKVFVLRPDAVCDLGTLPATCEYMSADAPAWLEADFVARPELKVETSDGTMAVFESRRPVQGKIALGGNAALVGAQLAVTHPASSGHAPKVGNATDAGSGAGAIYTDDDDSLVGLPAALQGQPLVRTAVADSASTDPDFLSFDLSVPADLYVLRDNAQGVPAWLAEGFVDAFGLELTTRKGRHLDVMKSKVPMQGRVTLGGNEDGPVMFVAIAAPTPFSSRWSDFPAATAPPIAVTDIKVPKAEGWDAATDALRSAEELVEHAAPGTLRVGAPLFADTSEVSLVAVPDALAGATFVQTAAADKVRSDSAALAFTVGAPADLYVLRDDAAAPAWLDVVAQAKAPEGALDVPASPVEHRSADGAVLRVRAATPFPPRGELVAVDKAPPPPLPLVLGGHAASLTPY